LVSAHLDIDFDPPIKVTGLALIKFDGLLLCYTPPEASKS
jgi:hypothetical protein